MVPGSGLEPLHLTAQASETCVSTNSTTRAIICSTIFYGNVAGSLFDFLTPRFPTICIKPAKNEKRGWERTNVTNLLRNRQSGTYYARVKVNGKQKWRGHRDDRLFRRKTSAR